MCEAHVFGTKFFADYSKEYGDDDPNPTPSASEPPPERPDKEPILRSPSGQPLVRNIYDKDKATFRILGNEPLFEIVKTAPRERAALSTIKGMPRGMPESTTAPPSAGPPQGCVMRHASNIVLKRGSGLVMACSTTESLR